MEEAIIRLKLAADAGADVCFIEGVKNKELLEATVAALAPKPVSPVHDLNFVYHAHFFMYSRSLSTSFLEALRLHLHARKPNKWAPK
jgi:hypothetical protein